MCPRGISLCLSSTVRLTSWVLTRCNLIELGLVVQDVVRLLSQNLDVHGAVQVVDALRLFQHPLLVLSLVVSVALKQWVEDALLALHLTSCQLNGRWSQEALI